jgi:hypothetical protein
MPVSGGSAKPTGGEHDYSERYRGGKLNLADAACDRLGLSG